MSDTKLTGLDLLRVSFNENQIGKLPKPTKAQTDALKEKPDGYKKGIRCKICGGWHHPDVVHLDYVGHAALTDRLLDCDPEWQWQPMSYTEDGLPTFSKDGLWIKLTVCGVTRLGFGDSGGKTGGNAIKELIGDALRNAAMRFGAALDLWHKGDLHSNEEYDTPKTDATDTSTPNDDEHVWQGPLKKTALRTQIAKFGHGITEKTNKQELFEHKEEFVDAITQAKIDMPELLSGNGDGISVYGLYTKTLDELTAQEDNAQSFKDTIGD